MTIDENPDMDVPPATSTPVESTRADDATTTTPVTTTRPDGSTKLTRQETRNVIFLVLAFSCVVASLAILAGTGAVVIVSIGGSKSIASFAVGCVFLGMSLVSLTLTHWIFERYPREIGFWCGCAIATGGAILGCEGIHLESTPMVLVANIMMGAGNGIGMYLRFAAVEVVRPEFASKAITWTLCGGCLAAFVGPEASAATTGAYGDGNLTYLGSFILIAFFSMAQAVFVGLIHFDIPSHISDATARTEVATETSAAHSTDQSDCMHPNVPGNCNHTMGVDVIQIGMTPPEDIETSLYSREASNNDESPSENTYRPERNTSQSFSTITLGSLLHCSDFTLPLLVSILSWAIMAMPMSFVRVPMRELGFSDRQSLTVVEFHFLGMYAPGFWSGTFIKHYGSIRAFQVAVACFVVGTAVNLSVQANNNTAAAWFLGIILLGIGWNFGFASATVWLTKVYHDAPRMKAKVQAANDCLMFFFSGGFILSTGYLYKAGGGGLNGWRTLNYAIMGLILILLAVVAYSMKVERRKKAPQGRGDS